jgi:hypothetical protein
MDIESFAFENESGAGYKNGCGSGCSNDSIVEAGCGIGYALFYSDGYFSGDGNGSGYGFGVSGNGNGNGLWSRR